ncbi:MAG: hypothetical protein IBX67_07520 [Dehalococcoidia bacterium]|nr:hypothetical protein [Dehalococcoidia bacterium]
MYRLIDTFDDFMRYWQGACDKTVEEKVELWATSYMQKYPELLQRQVRDYEESGYDWREIARNKVFPRLEAYLPLIKEARENLVHVCGPVYEQAVQALRVDFPVTFVIYVGIGCGAGLATQYGGSPACLLGLEKIAELGWHTPGKLRELVSHEIAHLVHMHWRDEFQEFEEHEKDPLFLLYSEGFAKRCENLILAGESWSQADRDDWLPWCEAHKGLLAEEYLHRVDHGKPTNDFFGDWLHVQGRSQTGYYLGWTLLLWLEENYDMREIAALSSGRVREDARRYLRRLADGFA